MALDARNADDIPFNQLMTGAGIATDKLRLLRSESTLIVETIERQELAIMLQAVLDDERFRPVSVREELTSQDES